MKRTIESIKPNEVVHCPTRGQAKEFMKLLHEAGKKWASGEPYLGNDYWDVHEEETCYNPQIGTFSGEEWYCDRYYTITNVDEFLTKVGSEFMFSKACVNNLEEGLTAEDFIKKRDLHGYYYPCGDASKPKLHDKDCTFCQFESEVEDLMIEYAKYHVKKAIEQIRKNANITDGEVSFGESEIIGVKNGYSKKTTLKVNKESIDYPLENIK